MSLLASFALAMGCAQVVGVDPTAFAERSRIEPSYLFALDGIAFVE